MSKLGPSSLWRSIVLTTGASLGVICLVWTLGLGLLGIKPIVFTSGSMSPAIHTGSVAFTRSVPATVVAPGDVVSVLTADGVRVTHRVVKSTPEGSSATLRLKGDANNTVDSETYTLNNVDVVVGQVPLLGYLLLFAASPAGMGLGLTLLVSCLWLGFTKPKPASANPAAEIDPVGSQPRRRNRVLVGVAGLIAGAVWLGATAVPTQRTLAFWSDSPTVMSPAGGIEMGSWFTCSAAISAATGVEPWAHWGFNESPGTQASLSTPFFADSVGTGHDSAYFVGTSSTAVSPSVGHSDACARDASSSVYLSGGIDSAAQYIRMQNPIQNQNGNSLGNRWNTFTINVWFKTNVSGGDDLAGALTAYSQAEAIGETNPEPPTDRVLYLDKNGLLKFMVYPGAYRVRASTINAADNEWHMATATLGPDGQCLYLDGVLQGTCDDSTTTAWQGNNKTGGRDTYWRFGNAIMSAGFSGIDDHNLQQRAFKGYLDDAAIWRTQLSAEQIREMYRAALPLP